MAKARQTVAERLESHIEPIPESGCWLFTGAERNSYGHGAIRNHNLVNDSAHRVAYREYIGEIPDDMCVCHKCDVPSCVNPAHLFLGSRADNSADMVKKGRASRGAGRYNAKFTDEDVMRIRAKHRDDPESTYSSLSREYGVAPKTVSGIVKMKYWRHVK